MSSNPQLNVVWEPHPKQAEALSRSEFEVLYGGSRGGGKTDCGLTWLAEETHNPKYRALVLRRNTEDLKDWTDRANQLYSILANPAIKSGNPPEFRFKSGAVIRTGHLKDDNAYTKYQGHEYHRVLIEELTQIPDQKHYLRLLSSCRSVHKDLKPQVFLTTNPGGKGHQWVKKRFIDPAPPGTTIWEVIFECKSCGEKKTKIFTSMNWVYKCEKCKIDMVIDTYRSRVFIQATMDDNPTLMTNDPQYVANIESLRDDDYETYMAWRFGDWDRFVGQVFREFNRNHHVIKPISPNDGTHYLWMDWGYSEHHETSFSAYLSTVIKSKTSDGQAYHQVITWQEFCGNRKDPEEWARIIYNSCNKAGIKPSLGICDPSMIGATKETATLPGNLMMNEWKRLNGGKSWCNLIKGKNSRDPRVGGWAVMHKWLSMPHGIPFWQITETCKHLIRTLPMLVYDEHNVEDVDTAMEDHPADACRYGLMHVKFMSVKPGSYSAIKKKRKSYLDTDERGMPVVNPSKFFGSRS